MNRPSARIRIDDDGRLEIVDPGFDMLPLLQDIDPQFDVRQSPLPGFSSPRFLRTRQTGTGLSRRNLRRASEADLWSAHDGLSQPAHSLRMLPSRRRHQASLLDLKRELARRVLTNCRLCAHRCGIDRTRGEMGICRLTAGATVAEHFVHIGEEAPINPSLVLNLAGCGLRCRYCQQSALLDPSVVAGDALDEQLWSKLDSTGARSLSFVGGNPDESLFAILGFLAAAPSDWTLPIVWNCHAYSTPETLRLLEGIVDAYIPDFKYAEGIVDAYIPDFKYANDVCAQRWSAAPGYVTAARESIAAMVAQEVVVIVRILVLPGHVECCHLPAVDFISELPRERLLLSVRAQYCPDWKITEKDGPMARRPLVAEVEAVRAHARARRLRIVDEPSVGLPDQEIERR